MHWDLWPVQGKAWEGQSAAIILIDLKRLSILPANSRQVQNS